MNRVFSLSVAVLLIILVIIGCGKSVDERESKKTVLRIAGSTSMVPVSERLARAYEKKHPGVRVHIEGGDSTLGIRGASGGIVDIGSVSRPLTREESKSLKSYKITEDSISIIVNEKNPVKALAINEIREVFSGTINNWSMVEGFNTPITLIGREHGSGTYRVFEDIVMSNTPVDGKTLVMTSTGAVLSTVARDSNAIGYVSSNYHAEGVRKLEIHTGEDRAIALKRPLLYVIPENTSELALDYINFCTGDEGRQIIAGYLEK
ncbi:MAG: phosphate ABC transporter substrate-binding protein [Bacillota bacterium]